MSRTRWHFGVFFAVLSAAVICFCLQPAGVVTAEDKGSKSSASSGSTAGDQESTADKVASTKSKKDGKSAKKKSNKKSSTKKTRGKSADQSTDGESSGQSSNARSSSGGSAASGLVGGSSGISSGAGGTGGGFPQGAFGNGGNGGNGGAGDVPSGAAAPTGPDPKIVQRVMGVQEKHTESFLKQEGIVGTATGLTKDGRVVLRVYTNGAGKPTIPSKIDGVETETVLSGPIRPLSGFAGSSKYNPQTRIARPTAIGVSALNEQSPSCSGSICATGTLGCRLKAKDGSGFYALSNNHVFADENAASIGNTIVQPGPLDNNCECAPDDVIGQLYKFKPIVVFPDGFNVIDAAIISTTDKLVSNSTLPDGYGAPRTFVWKEAFLGQKVMKYGRTTGFTKGIVVGVNVFAIVPYDPGLALFVRQVEIFGDGGLFGGPGDSGSLIVDRDRFPVALLFAGGGGFTIGNPIQDVLDYFNMEIDGDGSQNVVPPGKIGSADPSN